MAQQIELGSPQVVALQDAVQSKLMELGWITDNLDDTSLAEYFVLSITNGTGREALVTELSTDFAYINFSQTSADDFSRWLYREAEKILGVNLGAESQDDQSQQAQQSNGQDAADVATTAGGNNDAEMDDAKEVHSESIPTGPKSMRNTGQKPRDKRMLGQVNRAMDRSTDFGIHRIKGAAGGAGRINSHQRDPPKGPTPRGPRATMHRLAGAGPQQRMNNSMQQMNQGNMLGAMSPQQQMQLFAMYEEQARMMAQILSPQQQQQLMSNQMGFNPNAPQQPQQPGKSLFERIDTGNNPQQNVSSTPAQPQPDTASSMDIESSSQNADKPDPNTTMCRFNLACTKPDCHFAHQSPAAPPGVAIDMTDSCSFGAACQNRKCTGKHPSPAKLAPQRAEQDCKFFPNCTNPNCPFRHPSTPPCRNGADCNVPNCKFVHSKIACKFDPCLNPACIYKHAQGQKRGIFADKVWVPNEDGTGQESLSKSHVSDRKFVDEAAGEEELILPQKGDDNGLEGIAA